MFHRGAGLEDGEDYPAKLLVCESLERQLLCVHGDLERASERG